MMRRFELSAFALLLTAAPAVHAQAPAAPTNGVPAPAAPADSAPAPDAPTDAAPATSPSTPSATAPEVHPSAAPRTRATSRRPPASGAAAPSVPSTAPAAAASDELGVEPDVIPVPAAAIPTLSVWLGFGSLWVPSEGLDPFSEDDALVSFSAGAALSIAGSDDLDVAAVAGWDTTGSDAQLRGEATSLGIMRFALGPEVRGSIIDRLGYHGRLSPTLTRMSAELDETSSLATLSDTQWVWGAEAAVGLDFRFAETPASGLPNALGFFARIEAGYAWSPSVGLSLDATDASAPVRTEPLELADLSLSGPSFKASIGAGF
jgi:hypothetical protein